MTAHARSSMHDVLSDAIRYWEPRRVFYNLFLVVIVGCVAATFWADVRGHLSFELMLGLVVLAVLANVCYCAAYVVDIPMQFSVFRDGWRHWRWLLWAFGACFSIALAAYWCVDEILPALAGVQ